MIIPVGVDFQELVQVFCVVLCLCVFMFCACLYLHVFFYTCLCAFLVVSFCSCVCGCVRIRMRLYVWNVSLLWSVLIAECMYVCMCMCMYVCVCTYAYVSMCMYVNVCMYTCVCMYVCMHVFVFRYVCMYGMNTTHMYACNTYNAYMYTIHSIHNSIHVHQNHCQYNHLTTTAHKNLNLTTNCIGGQRYGRQDTHKGLDVHVYVSVLNVSLCA